MKIAINIALILSVICFGASQLAAQDISNVPSGMDSVIAKQVKWWQILKKKPRPAKKGSIYFIPVPIFSVNPTTDFNVGVGASINWFSADPSDTRISSAAAGVSYTLKNQLLSSFKSSIYTKHDDWILLGDWRYQESSQPGFGIGTGRQSEVLASTGLAINDDPYATQPAGLKVIDYNFLRVYETALRRIVDKFYMGIGYHLDSYFHVEDKLLDLSAPEPVVTTYYTYNVKNGFSQTSSLLSGASVNAIYDTRDNQNNPHKGRYIFVSFKYNPVFLGSTKNSSTLWVEYRDYLNLTRDGHNILAFWAFGNFTTSGVLPYWNLPTIGWDQFSKSGEGYVQGRFRGEDLVFSQAEFRRHLFGIKNNPNFMRVVVFSNMTTADNKESDIYLFKYVDPAFGAGLRVNVSPVARINVAIDYAVGFYGSMGIYFRLNETF